MLSNYAHDDPQAASSGNRQGRIRTLHSDHFFLSEFFYPLLGRTRFGAGVEQSFGCLIVQNRQAVQSMGRSMDWTLEDDMVDGLFFCATLTGRRRRHTPFVQAGAETSDTGAETVKPDPGSSWEGHSGRVGTGVWNENAEFCGVVRPLRSPLMIRPLHFNEAQLSERL